MKKNTISFLILIVGAILYVGFRPKSITSDTENTVPVKFYYLDSTNVNLRDSTYENHFTLVLDLPQLFNFNGPSKIVEIFYDRKFTRLAERITFTKKEKVIHYQRFDRSGELQVESFKKSRNEHSVFYSNNKIYKIATNNNEGMSDSLFDNDQKLNKIDFYYKNGLYKYIYFYTTGNVKHEIYYSFMKEHNVYTINYDSLTQIPKIYFNNDTSWEDKNNPGTYIGYDRLISADTILANKLTKLEMPIGFTSDFESVFTPVQLKKLDSLMSAIEKETTIKIAVVTLDSTFTTKSDFDTTILQLANKWEVGKKNKNNGIMIGISKSMRMIRIENGYGIEKKLSDLQTKEIINTIFIPQFKNDNFYEGTKQGIIALYNKVK